MKLLLAIALALSFTGCFVTAPIHRLQCWMECDDGGEPYYGSFGFFEYCQCKDEP